MKYDQLSSKLRSIASKTESDLAKNVIVKKSDGYQAYGEYHIVETPIFWEVTTDITDDVKQFNTSKAALAWCIAHKTHKYELASNIVHLDRRLAAKQSDIDLLIQRLKLGVSDPEIKLILECRLSEDIFNRQSYKKQLLKCVESAKYIKIKGSPDELNRFNKTS